MDVEGCWKDVKVGETKNQYLHVKVGREGKEGDCFGRNYLGSL